MKDVKEMERTSRIFLLVVALAVMVMTLSAVASRCSVQPMRSSAKWETHGVGCRVVRKYHPSQLEQTWLDNVHRWQDHYCDNLKSSDSSVADWLATIKAHDKLQPGHLATTTSPAQALAGKQQIDPRVFSRFVTMYDCGSGTSQEMTTWIEPLSHGLRHPNALCNRCMRGQQQTPALAQD